MNKENIQMINKITNKAMAKVMMIRIQPYCQIEVSRSINGIYIFYCIVFASHDGKFETKDLEDMLEKINKF